MRAMLLIPVLLLVAGCPKGNDDTAEDDTGGGECELGTFECYINTDATPTGDLACYTAGEAFLTQSVDGSLQVTENRTEVVQDFENETPVYNATVSIWYGDSVSGTADVQVETNDSGEVTFDAPACTPVTYLVTTPSALDETKDTYESHQVYAPIASASTDDYSFQSVSKTTYLVIPNLMGISVDPTASIIAGEVRDCNGEPIAGAEVVVTDAQGNIPDTLVVKYFVENFPNRDQPETSDDGLWVAINVPEGTWNVEAYVSDGEGGHVKVGTTSLQTYADSINISSIYYGFEGGVWYPAECLTTSK